LFRAAVPEGDGGNQMNPYSGWGLTELIPIPVGKDGKAQISLVFTAPIAVHIAGPGAIAARAAANKSPQTVAIPLLLALQRPDSDAALYNSLGNQNLGRQQYSEAVAYYRRAVELSPSHAEYLNNLAWALLAAHDVNEGLLYARRAAGTTNAPPAYIVDTLAHAEYMSGNWAAAAAAWEQVLKLEPDFYKTDLDPLCRKDLEHLADARRKAAAAR
jgi:tetratricopeptide (TPR) repeat protein